MSKTGRPLQDVAEAIEKLGLKLALDDPLLDLDDLVQRVEVAALNFAAGRKKRRSEFEELDEPDGSPPTDEEVRTYGGGDW